MGGARSEETEEEREEDELMHRDHLGALLP